jgi:hypothetical protein
VVAAVSVSTIEAVTVAALAPGAVNRTRSRWLNVVLVESTSTLIIA